MIFLIRSRNQYFMKFFEFIRNTCYLHKADFLNLKFDPSIHDIKK